MNKIRKIVSLVVALSCLLYTMPTLACGNEEETDQSCRIAQVPISNDAQTSSLGNSTTDKQPATSSADDKDKTEWEELSPWKKVLVISLFVAVATSLLYNASHPCEHCNVK